jgi:hypothetical protein
VAPSSSATTGAASAGLKRRVGQATAVSLADWVAECAVRCGLTLAQAADHSPAQLRLLASAASRIDAGTGLLNLHTTYAATAATVAKEGRTVLERLQKQLTKQAKGV